jgi:hypothetical protein
MLEGRPHPPSPACMESLVAWFGVAPHAASERQHEHRPSYYLGGVVGHAVRAAEGGLQHDAVGAGVSGRVSGSGSE